MKTNVKAAKNAWMFALLKYLKWLMENHPQLMPKNVSAAKAALKSVNPVQSPSKKPDRTSGALVLNQGPERFKLSYQIIPTAWGEAAVVFRNPPCLFQKIFLPSPDTATRIQLLFPEPDISAPLPSPADTMIRWISDYFLEKPVCDPNPMWEWLDFGSATRLQKAVYHTTFRIPYGQTRSYSQIAEAIGRSGASRFVGSTMANNPFPVLIPCHRVIRSNGSLGQFGGGADLKRNMLEIEARLSHNS
jgi:methylated-DNA-[protein]-cysteine S-methyltransferase